VEIEFLTAAGGVITGILGTEVVKRLVLAGGERETTAQGAIIELAQSAMAGWRDESASVATLTQVLRDHDESVAMQLDGVRVRSERTGERLREMDDKLSALFVVVQEATGNGR
jgi:hypothetical protein